MGRVGLDDVSLTPPSRQECLCLLASTTTGRLGFHANALPMLLPVDFAVDGDSVVICVRAGSQADAATRNAVVAFQADGVDLVRGWRWTVSVTGMAKHVSDPSALARVRALPLDHAGGDIRFVSVSADVVSGRRARIR